MQNQISWLLEPANPSVRYFTLRKLLNKPEDDPEVRSAREAVLQSGPAPALLALQSPDGWWGNPEFATKPLYTGTFWVLMDLAELAPLPGDPRIWRGMEFALANAQGPDGDYPPQGSNFHKFNRGDLLCSDGKNLWALLRLGMPLDDPRMIRSVSFLTDVVRQEGFCCRFNAGKPCAWGCVKALRALAEIPAENRAPDVQEAIRTAADFLLAGDLATANYPVKDNGKVSDHWFKLGFPRSYQADVLQTLVVLADLGYASDPRLAPALDFIQSRRRPDGTWKLEETPAKMPVPFEKKGPSKWITWQALYVLQSAGRLTPVPSPLGDVG